LRIQLPKQRRGSQGDGINIPLQTGYCYYPDLPDRVRLKR
jgi:hypothetical protein